MSLEPISKTSLVAAFTVFVVFAVVVDAGVVAIIVVINAVVVVVVLQMPLSNCWLRSPNVELG